MAANGQLVFTDVDKVTFKGVGNASNAVIDTTTGKIGVGVDSPDANLHVLGNCFVSTNFELGGTMTMGTVTVRAQHELSAITATGNTTPHTIEFTNAETGIVTTGNVGIGTTSPDATLHVSGNAYVSSNLEVGTANLFVDTVNSRVGIGMTSPQYKLDVGNGGGDVMLRVMHQTASSGKLIFGRSGNTEIRSHAIESYNSSGSQNNYMKFLVHDGTGTSPYETRTEVMTLLGNGNVGIGTTSPDVKLHVEHYGSAIGDFEGIRIANHATNLHATSRPAYEFVVSDIDAGTGIGNGTFAIGYRDTTSASRTDRLVIDASGNVGIGTTNPVAKFNIQGTSEGAPPTSGGEGTSNGIFRLRDNFNVALDIGTLGASPWSTWLQVADTTTMGTEYPLSLNPNGGNVGIGNRNPLGKLDIFDTDAVRLRLTTSSTNARGSIDIIRGDGGRSPGDYTFGASNYYDWRIGSDDTTDYNFSIRSKNTSLDFTSFYIKGLDGNVGIGTTTPLGRLHVQTETRSGTEGSGNGIYVTSGCAEYSNGSEFRHSNQSQGVGIGYAGIYATGSNTNQDLSIVSRGTGNTYVKNYAVFSDDRIKTNEEYIMNATETLMKLKPQVYDKHEEINVLSDNPKREAGLIAQDIYYDTPELRYIVSTRNRGIDAEPVNIPSEKPFVDDDPQKDPDYSGWGTASAGVAYIQLVPYLIRSNQEIYTELQAEKARNDSLEARILALENA